MRGFGPAARILVILTLLTLNACTLWRIAFPVDPPPGAKPYPGKPTHFVIKGAPVPYVLDLGVLRYSSWPTWPSFQTFAICPLGKGKDTRCLHFYGGVKVDGTLTDEWRKVYGGKEDEYVLEFKRQEQSAAGLHVLDEACTWANMGRC
jgi:hypothetical protein